MEIRQTSIYGFLRAKSPLIALIVIASVLVWGRLSSGETEVPSLKRARDILLSYFKPLRGSIIAMQEGYVVIDLGREDGLKKGMRLSIFREGRMIYHPVTGEPLGRAEESIGTVEVMETETGSSVCRILRGQPGVGDGVRITSSRIRLAFFQDRDALWEVSDLFYRLIKDSGRFEILSPYVGAESPEKLSKTAEDLNAEAFLILSTPLSERRVSLRARLFWTDTAEGFAEIEVPVGKDTIRRLRTEDAIFTGDITIPLAEYRIKDGRLITAGDIDGDGRREILIGGRGGVRVYNYSGVLQELGYFAGDPTGRVISIDTLDLNGNGREEIFVSSIRGDSPGSYVLEYDPSIGFRTLWDNVPYLFRVMDGVLLAQRFTLPKGYTGAVHKIKWEDGTYRLDGTVSLPKGTDIYRFVYLKGSGRRGILVMGQDGYLRLYEGGRLSWKGKVRYGDLDKYYIPLGSAEIIGQPAGRWYPRQRMITPGGDLGVIIVRKVPYLSLVPGLGYRSSEIYSIWWDGATVHEDRIMGDMPGGVVDYWVEDGKILLLVRQGFLTSLADIFSGDTSGRSILYSWKIGLNRDT